MLLESFARIHFAKGEPEKALEYLGQIREHKVGTQLLLGDIHSYLGNYDKAIDAYKVAKLVDDKAPVDLRLAVSHYLQSNWTKAAELVETFAEKYPKIKLYRLFRAACFLGQQLLTRAMEEPKAFSVRKSGTTGWRAWCAAPCMSGNRSSNRRKPNSRHCPSDIAF